MAGTGCSAWAGPAVTADMRFRVRPSASLQGGLRVPGDKSISHRALMLSALAQGETRIEGFLEGLDCLATRDALHAMGVEIEGPADGCVAVRGVGLDGLRPAGDALDLGNSGTSIRLLTGLLAGQPFDSVLTGDASLRRRPMGRVIEPLTAMGAMVQSDAGGRAPLHIRGGRRLHGIDYRLPIASAQVKSAVILAGLYAEGPTVVHEPAPSRDHTERMLRAMGYPIVHDRNGGVRVCGPHRLLGTEIRIPADISSAAFFIVGASIAGNADVLLAEVGINPTRTGIIDILRRMGADIRLLNERHVGAEPVADIHVRSAALHGVTIPPALVPLAIDEFPAIFVAAACARGETVLTGAAELRVKESDRIQVMAAALDAIGVEVTVLADGIRIIGRERLAGGLIDSLGDHRVAMAMAMAALRAEDEIVIRDCANVDTSFPRFASAARSLGLDLVRQ